MVGKPIKNIRNALFIRCIPFSFNLLFCLILTNCLGHGKNGRKGLLPASTGQPYEVVLEGDSDSIVTQILAQEVMGLPQAEPLFNLIQVRQGSVKGSYLLVRNRVVVSIDEAHKTFAVKMNKDENAYPQLVIRIMAANPQQLRNHLNGEKLRSIIDQAELAHLASIIKQNVQKQQEAKKHFAIDIKIPADMDASKLAKDFAWYSNNANTGMQNLLFLRLRGKGNEARQIDSILHKNMPGETDDMYMQIAAMDSQANQPLEDGTIHRGLWEMKGDAMGGPYVIRRMGDIVIMGFVYAPEKKKRNLIKQLEAVLTTAQKTK